MAEEKPAVGVFTLALQKPRVLRDVCPLPSTPQSVVNTGGRSHFFVKTQENHTHTSLHTRIYIK